MTVDPKVDVAEKVPDAIEKKQDSPQVDKKEETQEEINWKKFREAREIDRKKREQAEQDARNKAAEAAALKEAMEALLNKPGTPNTEVREDSDLSEDDRIQQKIDAALKKERDREAQERAKRENSELPHKLRQAYPDFERTCSQENMDYLEYHHPETYRALRNQPDNFNTWSDVYKAMKRYIPNTDSKRDMAKIDKNLSKPQSMSQPGATQTGDQAPLQTNEKRYADNWSRMQRTLKGIK